MDTTIDLSNTDDPSPPKQQCTNRPRRQSRRKQTAPLQSRRTSSRLQARRGGSAVAAPENTESVIVIPDSVDAPTISSGVILLDSSEDSLDSPISPVVEESHSTSASPALGANLFEDSLCERKGEEDNEQPEAAKVNSAASSWDSETTTTETETRTYNTAVYSQQVIRGFKNFFQFRKRIENKTEEEGKCSSPETLVPCDEVEESSCDSSDGKRGQLEKDSFLSDEEEDEETEVTEPVTVAVRSPTPPPQFVPKVRRKSQGMNKKVTTALRALTQAKETLYVTGTPQKKNRKGQIDVFIVGEETPPKTEVVVKVRYLSTVHRITMKQSDPFHTLVKKLGNEIGEQGCNLSLYLHDKCLELNESPHSVELSVADIIECHRITIGELNLDSADTVSLFVQCKDRRTRVAITAHRRLPLSHVLKSYAEKMKLPTSNFKFLFDGDDVEPGDTPNKLDMEEDDVLDVVLLKT